MRGNHRRKGMEARNRMVWARDYTSMVFLRHREQGRNCLGNQAYVDTNQFMGGLLVSPIHYSAV